MATVQHSITIKDAKTIGTARVKNTQSVLVRHALGAATIEELTAWNLVLQGLVDDVTDGVIIASTIQIAATLNVTNKATPVAGSDVQEGGSLVYQLEDVPYTDAIRIPAFTQSLFGADGQSIANTGAVGLLSTFLQDGDITAPFAATNEFEIAFTEFIAGKKSFRK